MRKLLTLAVAIVLAATTHAAAIGWTIAGTSAYSGGTYDVFVIGLNGVTGVSQITALVEAGTDVASYAFGTGDVGTTASAPMTTSGKSITYSGSGTDSYSAFAVLWKADGKEASYTSTATIQLANDSTGKTFGFGNQSSNLAANNFTVNVPEPTSGLMLLLGVAGLALKRKRA